jgi:hypothetical protein
MGPTCHHLLPLALPIFSEQPGLQESSSRCRGGQATTAAVGEQPLPWPRRRAAAMAKRGCTRAAAAAAVTLSSVPNSYPSVLSSAPTTSSSTGVECLAKEQRHEELLEAEESIVVSSASVSYTSRSAVSHSSRGTSPPAVLSASPRFTAGDSAVDARVAMA